jgi:arsenite-transporting ATPase
MRTILIAGTSGVGKTSHAVATALACAERGKRVFLLSADPTRGLSDLVGVRVGPAATRLAPRVFAQEISPETELEHSWQGLRDPFEALLRDDVDGVLTEELLSFSALEELLALRAVCEIARAGEIEVCVVDCAPTLGSLQLAGFPGALRTVMKNFFSFERRGPQLLQRLLRRPGRRVARASGFDEALARLERGTARSEVSRHFRSWLARCTPRPIRRDA